MNCDETRHYLYVYLDGEATILRRWRIRRHFRQCPHCEHGYVFEERLKLRVREGCREEMPRELVERLRTLLQGRADDGM